MRRSRWLGLVALLGVIVLLDSEPAGGQFGRPGGGDRGPGGPGGGPGGPGGFGGSPGGFGGDRGSSGRGGFTMDPEMVWNQFYGGQGKDSINLNERPDIKSRMQQRGQAIPPDGILTKAAFTAEFQKRMAERAAGGGGFGGPPGGTPFGGAPGAPQVATITPPGAPGTMPQPGFTPQPGGGPSWGGRGGPGGPREDETIREFRRADRNNDGKVTPEEASNRLREQFAARDLNRDGAMDQEEYRQYYIDAESTDKFREYDRDKDGRISFDEAGRSTKEYFPTIDTNKDNFIDPAEYKTYMSARLTGTLPPPPSASGAPTPYGGPTPPTATAYAPQQPGGPWNGNSRQPQEEPRPTSIRFGHLPKEVPGWFTELDSDKDGQIGLYEWKKDGRLMAEFVEMDLNGDGLLTAEEWMKSQRMKLDQQKLDELIASVGGPPAETTGSGRPSGGGGLGYRGPWGGAPSPGGTDKGGGNSDRSKGGDRGPGGPGGGFGGFSGMKGGDRPSMGGDRPTGGPGGPGGFGGNFGGFNRGGRPGGDTKAGDTPRADKPEKAEKPEKGGGEDSTREKGSKGNKDMRKSKG